MPSLSQDMMLKLLESDETKNYVSNAVKLTVPMLAQAGLGFAVPFLSPLIIAASSGLLLKGLKLAGDRIDIAYDKLQPYKEQEGTKGFLAKIESPCLTVAKKILPVSEKTLYEALSDDDGSKLQKMFKIILDDPNKRKEFEDKLQKFLTGDYSSSKEFQNAVKQTLGIKADRLALEAYTQFTGIIYDKEILNKIILLSEEQISSSTQIKRSIEESVEKLQSSYEAKYKEFKEQVTQLRNQFYESHGLYRLVPNYFEEEDYDVNKDMNAWKSGPGFTYLHSIKQNKEFRRNESVEQIKKRLESQNRQLIVGESGTSKSTILMEIICDYYDQGYEILWNRDDASIKEGIPIINFIKEILNNDSSSKVLVAVDNVNDERTSAIFYVMDQISISKKKNENVKFILTARIPEFNRFIQDRLGTVKEEAHRRSINNFIKESRKNTLLKYQLGYFSEQEVRDFISKYKDLIPTEKQKSSLNYKEIFKYTSGLPIMVKFAIFGDGLRADVEERHNRVLYDQNEDKQSAKIHTALVCSLLDMSNIQIDKELLEYMDLYSHATELESSILYRHSSGSKELWKTIHPRWDMELLSFLYDSNTDLNILEKRKRYLENALNSIFELGDQIVTTLVTAAIYDVAANKMVDMAIVESVFQIPNSLTDELKSLLYAAVIGPSYYKLQKYQEAIECYDKAPNDANAWYNKGVALGSLGRHEEAITSYDKATEIKPDHAGAWYNKGVALKNLGRHEEAITSYDKSIEINPNDADVWINRGISLDNLGRHEEAITSYDKATEIKPDYAGTWYKRGAALHDLGRYEEAIQSYDKAIEIDPNDADAWINKAWIFANNNKNEEALHFAERSLEIDPNNAAALDIKGFIFYNLNQYEKALEYYDKALKLEPNDAEIWNHKGFAFDKLGRGDEAQNCFNKAKQLGLNK